MATSQAQRLYQFSEFTTASGSPNTSIFATEVSALALSVQPDSVTQSGTTVVLQWASALPTAADMTLIDAAVADHPGDAFGDELQSAVVEAEDTNDTTTESVRVTLDTGKLPAGDYQVAWSAEIAVDAVVAGTGAQVNFYVTKNAGSRTERGSSANGEQLYITNGSVAYLEGVVDGDEFLLEIGYKKVGAPANTAKIQRARIYLKPVAA